MAKSIIKSYGQEWTCEQCGRTWVGDNALNLCLEHEKQDHPATINDVLKSLDEYTQAVNSAISNLIPRGLLDQVARDRVINMLEKSDILTKQIKKWREH